ncbi:MAG: PepSY-like domain-containing protein [Muribaculaceae bacterium]|nr:PepSY-like domain-containing protein [Muribaculaceae bacterium]
MNSKFFRNALLLGVGVAMTGIAVSCSDDDEVPAAQVPAAVTKTFNDMYPNARGVEWDKYSPYYIADFEVNTFDTDAWFTPDGTWAMTETDYGSLLSMLPVEMQTTFNDSKYADWIVDDVQLYQRVADTFSLIEVETDGMPETGVFIDSYGNILNVVQGDDFDITPTTIVENITF